MPQIMLFCFDVLGIRDFPNGHPKLLQAGRSDYGDLGHDGDARDSLFQPVTPALEFQHCAAVHEPVQDGGGHGGVGRACPNFRV